MVSEWFIDKATLPPAVLRPFCYGLEGVVVLADSACNLSEVLFCSYGRDR